MQVKKIRATMGTQQLTTGIGSGNDNCWIGRRRVALGLVRLRLGDDGSQAGVDGLRVERQ